MPALGPTRAPAAAAKSSNTVSNYNIYKPRCKPTICDCSNNLTEWLTINEDLVARSHKPWPEGIHNSNRGGYTMKTKHKGKGNNNNSKE